MKWLLLMLAFVLGAAITWFLTVKHASRTVQEGAGAAAELSAPEPTPVVSPSEPVAGAAGVAGGADLAAAAGAGVLATEPAGTSQRSHDEVDVDAAGFGGPHTPLSESRSAAESWDRNAEDEDALLSRASEDDADDAPVAEATPNDGAASAVAPVVDATPNDGAASAVAPVVDATPNDGAASAVAPVVDATPNGDLAGVGEPEAVAALEEEVEEDDAGSWADEVPDVEPSQEDDLDADVSVARATNIVPVADATPSGDVAGVAGPGALPTQGELTFDEPDDSVPPEEKP
ncbi:hypothetical protein ASH01_11290 [Terrabacter sp. Soil811]|uniref:channel accessory protein ArfC n=1 Tax=Terrabacter sp. Soil811 TaxID=1736419 RepID=UPI0006F380B4|nr:hypothetical protein [Terrabacter sp. Soil811]KRF44573.1 hypothetical protein ASH01_11290 [Terrabacter sp. Soil811]